jgi:hypothetical protein
MQNDEMSERYKKYRVENSYGMVVLYDDFYFNLEKSYDLAFAKSKERGFNFTYKYIKSNVSVFSLLQLENKLNLYGGDVFQLLNKESLKSDGSRLTNYKSIINELITLNENEIEARIKKNRK